MRKKSKANPSVPSVEAVTPVRSSEELRKLLFIQDAVVRQATKEMLTIASNPRLTSKPALFITAERRLLEKYVSYPTLTEFAQDPLLTNIYKWGATFGVAALVGLLVVEEVKHLQPHFSSVARQLYLILLKELDKPQHKFLIEPLQKALELPAKSESAAHGLLAQLVEYFAMVSVQFGLMDTTPAGLALTSVGKRALLHLADAQRFVEEMGQAHAKFQPKP